MIALDTNILLRYLVQDGGEQAVLATRLIERDLSAANPGFVSIAVVCEVVWALRSNYRQPRQPIVEAIEILLRAGQIEVEAEEAVALGLRANKAQIADGIIHYVGRARGCERTLTLDEKFARLEGVELLS